MNLTANLFLNLIRPAGICLLIWLVFRFSITVKAETVLIATDIHHLSEELTDDGAAFMQLLRRGDGKLTHYSTEITDAFLQEAVRIHPDVVLLTGDLSFNGETVSLEDLAERLSLLTENGIPVAAFPGNHDLNNSNARSFSGSVLYSTPIASQDDFLRIFRPYGYDQALQRDPHSLSYVCEVSDTLRLLCIDVNTPEAPGILTQETLDWAEQMLQEADRQSIRVIGASHQNLLGHNAFFIDGFRMGNAASLLELFRKYHVTLHLSGHTHLQHISTGGNTGEDTEEDMPAVTEIVTSALTVSPCHYALLTVTEDSWEYKAVETNVQAEGIDDFRAYGDAFADSITRGKLEKELQGSAASDAEREALITDTLTLNRAYFGGYLGDVLESGPSVSDILGRWQKYSPAGFMQVYLLSISKEQPVNMTTASGKLKKR